MRNPWTVATALAKRGKPGKLSWAESPAEQQDTGIHPAASSTKLLSLSLDAEQPQSGLPLLAGGSASLFQMIS